MRRHLRYFKTEAERQAWINSPDYAEPHVSYVSGTNQMHYNSLFALSTNSIEINVTGDTSFMTIESSRNWTATTTENWLTVSPSTGGTGTTNVSVTANATDTARSCEIHFNNVGMIKSVAVSQVYEEIDYSTMPLTFDILSAGTICWKSFGSGAERTIYYSKDDGETWSSITSTSAGVTIDVNVGDRVLFRANNAKYASSKSNYSGFDGGTAKYNVEGNIMSLVGGDNFTGTTAFTSTFNFCSLFKQSNVVSAKNLVLPVMTLTEACYRAMFSKAQLLVEVPALPATTLSRDCYWYMFEECPITRAPELHATTLAQGSYGNMFIGCTNLNYVKCLATNISASSSTANWLSGVSATGVFVKDSNMSDWTTGVSGIPAGWEVDNNSFLASPVISCDGEEVTLNCEASGSTIYYRLGGTGNYSEYTSPISISADTEVEAYSRLNQDTSTTVVELCEYISSVPLEASNRSLSSWKYNNVPISVPYSVNAIDGHTSSYAKGTFNFETSFTLQQVQPTYLWFQHADQSADIYVDNVKVTTHWGGYNAFFTDITNYVHVGKNDVKVALCNTTRSALAPCAGDFNFNATLGKVKLLTSPVLPNVDYGYDGFHITSTVSDSAATVNVKTTVPSGATLVCTIDDGTYHYSDTGTSVGSAFTFTTTISNPHLWNGLSDPHMYTVTLEIYHEGVLYHRFQRPYGLRYYDYVINETISGETYTGFLLNGKPYQLRGVCMHSDIDGKANALTDSDINNDFNLILELGCNFIRLAHYPHPKEVYDKCDELGIIVQTEVPCVNNLRSDQPADYYTHLESQYADMVNQHYNHPCIMFWGLSNETTTDDKDFGKTKIEAYTSQIKALDPERWVGYVVSHSISNPSSYYNNPDVDWFGCNIYVGWYIDKASNDPTSQLNTRVNNTITSLSKPLAFSEYGCGGTQHCHSENPQETTTKGNYERHDIEYQMWLHEGHLAAIRNFPQLLFTAQWQLFDIAVSNRNEGYTVCLDGETTSTDDNLRRLNNKGLVERDHVTKKDTFYLYKAEWSHQNFVHICGKDYTRKTGRTIKCYTNDGTTLSLYVNNVLAEIVLVSNNIAVFTSANYNEGDIIRVEGNTTNDTFMF